MSKTLRTLTAAMLLLASGVALTFPTAQAHSCGSVDPANACGGCPSGDAHDHYYAVDDRRITTYCKSPGPTTVVWDLLSGGNLP